MERTALLAQLTSFLSISSRTTTPPSLESRLNPNERRSDAAPLPSPAPPLPRPSYRSNQTAQTPRTSQHNKKALLAARERQTNARAIEAWRRKASKAPQRRSGLLFFPSLLVWEEGGGLISPKRSLGFVGYQLSIRTRSRGIDEGTRKERSGIATRLLCWALKSSLFVEYIALI